MIIVGSLKGRGVIKKILLVTVALLLAEVSLLKADTIYLKNGRTIEGFIVEENPERIQVDVGFGRVGLKRNEIDNIYFSDEKDSGRLRDKWIRQKVASEKRRKEEELKEELAPKNVNITDDRGQIVVVALLNKKINATLILDTGASLVVIKDSVAKQLGIDTGSLKGVIKLRLADGRESAAKHAVLSSISVQGVEATNVDVAILSSDAQDPSLKDGLLGMTYLKNFSFKIDQKNKKLTLERF